MEQNLILFQNLGFYRRMRNFYYEKAWRIFHNLDTAIAANPNENIASIIEQLKQYTESLEITFEYAQNAVRGYGRVKTRSYREDNEFGIMEEEVVFLRMLDELQSSGAYLLNRFDTDENIHKYIRSVETRKYSPRDKKGFLSNIVTSLEAAQKTDHEEILQVSKLIRRRFRIANNIFSVFQRRDTSAAP